ncbi:suppressor of fused domain protein [Mycolicibacterium diernhoferi]|uniref:Suppressor of fused protein (SUFU) n=1 Tax=Mycolicibacterium diernhoferi TaxID=1801 RepID=A0A1Q4H8Y9_9MYCO|nr:suppressor of fused domain protein [Mycolicibacterium diernhoferi]OJZ63841.1 Suppressor of fused protein (SUFU) [Mycolicibacterium diernhoferi]OPE55226.1 Suppressor of fused protein (SUFU) [Mycolicibacterium diernhoferi]PEG54331.1 Suppressor of fused protein (SUFU) [Mycolicibacterium diernhoferi]QYL21580.1 suppressor of fused domain protein [Mycolicibacterium diernhoferi]
MVDVLAEVRHRLQEHFTAAGVVGDPAEASVTFLGAERISVLRFGPDADGVNHFVTLGCSRYPMVDPTNFVTDTQLGPRAELVVSLRPPSPTGLARSMAVLAAAPSVEGLVLEPDALVDLSAPLFSVDTPGGPRTAPFTAFLLGPSPVEDIVLPEPLSAVTVLQATPITPTEAAWVRLKGAEAMREAWRADGVDVFDAGRRASEPS